MNTLLRKINRSASLRGQLLLFSLYLLVNVVLSGLQAAEFERSTNQVSKAPATSPLAAVLTPAKWQEVEKSVDRALAWMATQQRADGSFPTYSSGQPGVTSLATMAFLSRGHQPGLGPYGQGINRAIDFVISCQLTNGLISYVTPGPEHKNRQPSHTAVYNHAISGLMLGEVYGQVSGQRAKAAKQAIERALQFSRQLQLRPKRALDKGGWRYIPAYYTGVDSDLSVTGWQLMFLRSARNAEFYVPQASVDEAIAYVRRLWDTTSGAFNYQMYDDFRVENRISRGMTGAGILCLSLAGQHQTSMAKSAGDWLLAHPFKTFGELIPVRDDRFFYGAYYCSQAMAQLGGHYWEQFFPPLVDVLLRSQEINGNWPVEPGSGDGVFGNTYSSALAVLSLTPPYQLLPVYQR